MLKLLQNIDDRSTTMAVLEATRLSPTATTTELLCAAGDGSSDAWDQLVRRFEGVVNSAIRAYRLQDADARDAAQRTWLQLIEHHRQLRNPEALGGWLATTARRECLRTLRVRQRTAPIAEAEELSDPRDDTEERVVDAVAAGQVRALMELLAPRARTLLFALFEENPPAYAELSRRTGIPVGSIGPTRARALGRLRELIDESSPGLERWRWS
jgi:RNA polymerase sigma factor (sigma-70 family)